MIEIIRYLNFILLSNKVRQLAYKFGIWNIKLTFLIYHWRLSAFRIYWLMYTTTHQNGSY